MKHLATVLLCDLLIYTKHVAKAYEQYYYISKCKTIFVRETMQCVQDLYVLQFSITR